MFVLFVLFADVKGVGAMGMEGGDDYVKMSGI